MKRISDDFWGLAMGNYKPNTASSNCVLKFMMNYETEMI
jgi:hypothetical protein